MHSCSDCKYLGADPDGAYCGHPKSLEASHGFGLAIPDSFARTLGTICPKPSFPLWEKREVGKKRSRGSKV